MPRRPDPLLQPPEEITYGGQGTTSSFTKSFYHDGKRASYTFNWSVPDEIVPGMPAKVRIDVKEAADPGLSELYYDGFVTLVLGSETIEYLHGKDGRTLAGVRLFRYHFLKNLYHGQSLIEALKNTAKEAGNNVLASWISEETKSNANRSVTGWAGAKARQAASTVSATTASVRQSLTAEAPPAAAPAGTPASPGTKVATEEVTTPKNSAMEEPVPATPSGSTTESDASIQVRSRATVAGNGKTYANADDVLEIMRDPRRGYGAFRGALMKVRTGRCRQFDLPVRISAFSSAPVADFSTP